MDGVGTGVALSGQALRVLVIGFAYIKRGGRRKRITADRLVCEGIFAHVRNPMYLGNLLIILGLALIANSPWWYLLVAPGFATAYFAIVLAEEDFLAKKFGKEYEEYCRRVNRFVPRFTGLAQSLRPFAFDWKRVIRKEYGTTFTWTSTTLLLLIWERWEQFGYAKEKAAIQKLLLPLPFLGLAYLTVLALKKYGKLRS